MECNMLAGSNNQCYKIFAEYGTTGLWFMDDKGVWLSCDPSKNFSSNFRCVLHDWMLYHKADRIRPELGMTTGCITIRMFNAIGEHLANILQKEISKPVFYQPIKESELFYKIINDINHVDELYKM